MKKASYTIVTKPYFISLECPHCDWTVEIYYEDALKIANNYYDLWAGNGVVEIMTCNDCGCSFTDVDSEDYTEVFTTGLCCECILEEN